MTKIFSKSDMMRRDLVEECGHLDDPVAARQAGAIDLCLVTAGFI
jgi:hypothetical protein